MVITSYWSAERSRNRRPSSTTIRASGERTTLAASAWKKLKSVGTLGTSSTAVARTPQDTSERNVVPIPSATTIASRGGRSSAARGRWAIILVIADSAAIDRKSTRLNSSHVSISYAVFCLKKKNNNY